jgi:carboxylesterase
MPRPLPPASAEPFVVDVARPVARALLVHGYTGTPYEMLPLAHWLREAGVSSTGIVLPGHERGKDGDPRALNRVAWRDWVGAAEAALDAIDDDVPLVVGGCSMGALVSLHLCASRVARVRGAILLAPALRFYKEGVAAASLAARGLWRVVPWVKKTNGSDVADDEGRWANPCLEVLPLRGIAELYAMQSATGAILGDVKAPLCIFHGAQDHTIPPLASTIVARAVESQRVEHHLLRDSFHVVGLDRDRDALGALAASFASELCAREATV